MTVKRPSYRDSLLWTLGAFAGTGMSSYLDAICPASIPAGWAAVLAGSMLVGISFACWYWMDDLIFLEAAHV